MVERKERTPQEIASLPHVVSVRALEDYEVEVTFENGERRIFDVKPYMTHGVFTRLKDRSLFEAVRVVAGSIEWPGEIDLSYETLYIQGQPISEPGNKSRTRSGNKTRDTGGGVDRLVNDKRSHYNSSSRPSISTEEGLDIANKMVRTADENSVNCALCGGLAMHIYGFTRATVDVDFIATARLPLQAARELEMGGDAYNIRSDEQKEIEVDWIVRDDDKKEVYEAALAGAVSTEKGLPIITPEWMVILKYLAGRGKDQIDLMWLLREKGLVDRELVKQHISNLFGRYAFWPLADMDNLFLEADLMKARDQNRE
ncbi:MAG TPA: DUF2442 domain-containing protein [Blastocatellia bacterium]|nr:DUF2442 domain-containing protein [Blastocatellia bacterium]